MDPPIYATFFPAAFFFAAQRFFIATDNAFRPASVRPPFLTGALAGAGFFAGNGAFAVTAVGVAFFRFAEDAFIAADIALLNSVSSGGATMAARVFEIFGVTGSALATLIAAQRLFCPSAILRRVAALSPFFLGAGATFALGLTRSDMAGSSKMLAGAEDPPCNAVMAASSRSRSLIKRPTICSIGINPILTLGVCFSQY
jgi:hypothetical protein